MPRHDKRGFRNFTYTSRDGKNKVKKIYSLYIIL